MKEKFVVTIPVYKSGNTKLRWRQIKDNDGRAVGDASVKTRYTVVPSPTTATADSDFGFSETFEFFEPSKNFDPETGEDFT